MIIQWTQGANAQLQIGPYPAWTWATGDGGAAPVVEAPEIDDGAGSGKYQPEDWEVVQWLEAMFPAKEPEPSAQDDEQQPDKPPPKPKLAVVNVEASDLQEYAPTIAKMGRVIELFSEYQRLDAIRRKQERERMRIRIRARLAAVVQAYIARQRRDEAAIILILSAML